jgi:hypothetical protein
MAKHKSSVRGGVALKRQPTQRKRKSAATSEPTTPESLYAVHPGVAMVQKWIQDLTAKTGRSLVQWIAHIKQAGPKSEKDCRDWLKDQYQLGTNSAWWLAEKALADSHALSEDTPEAYLRLAPVYVEKMYAGPRSALRLIHDELVRLARQLPDVRICPCKTIVPLYRRHVFAQIKPATNKRIDLGLALGEEPFTSRLRDTGGRAKKDRITHSVALASLDDIDLQVKRWLKQAYERDA